MQVGSLWDSNPAEAPTTPRPRGQLGKSPQAQILAPLDTDSCGSTSVYAVLYFFLLEWESKSLTCVPLFQDQDEKL